MDTTLKIICCFALAVPLVSANQNAVPASNMQGAQYGQMMYNPNYMPRFARPQMPFVPQQQYTAGQFGPSTQYNPSAQYRANYQKQDEDIQSEGQQDYPRYSQGFVDPKQYQGYYQPQSKAVYSKEDYPVSSKDIESENNMQFTQQTNKMLHMPLDPRSMPMDIPSQVSSHSKEPSLYRESHYNQQA